MKEKMATIDQLGSEDSFSHHNRLASFISVGRKREKWLHNAKVWIFSNVHAQPTQAISDEFQTVCIFVHNKTQYGFYFKYLVFLHTNCSAVKTW